MSSLIVEVCRVDAVEKHPHADRLSICTVKGWRVCAGRDPDAGRDQFQPGDPCIYIPPDAVLPPELSDRLGCTKYLSPLAKYSAFPGPMQTGPISPWTRHGSWAVMPKARLRPS